MQHLLEWIVDFVQSLGYIGIFIMTFIESSFIPIPAEVTMIPAGYLVQQGVMHGWLVMVAATLGCVSGALFNYWIAAHYGRRLLANYGKYFFMTEKKLAKMETFFEDHGDMATFSGRLLPGVRHYISFPAGLAHMNLRRFIIYTASGGGIWMFILLALGYYIGEEKDLMKQFLPWIIWSLIAFVVVGGSIYYWFHPRTRERRKQRKNGTIPH